MKKPRTFVSEDFVPSSWEVIEPYYMQLLETAIPDVESFRKWLQQRSELEAIISENGAWRYIRMTCDTSNNVYREAYTFFITEIEPKIAPLNHKLNEKVIQCPYRKGLTEPGFQLLFRNIETDFKLFREENIPLKTEIQNLSRDYGAISGAMTVTIDGKTLTLQQAATILESPDRTKREFAYRSINERRYTDHEKLHELYTKLIGLRHQVARNAGFENFRDYMFEALGRFDYAPADCFQFHESVMQEVVPMLNDLAAQRKEKLGLADLRPWDKAVDTSGKPALKAFENSKELIEKSIQCFTTIDGFLGNCLQTMQQMEHLDLESRQGKAPGGYNYPLSETGVPFIFMNATSTLRDVVTMMHEGGHAVHSFLTHDLELSDFKSTPSEVAELASMSMELISMDFWHIFFPDKDDLRRAKKDHLSQIIETLPWVAIIDKFQHWIYENPSHTEQQRIDKWLEIYREFSDNITNWRGLEKYRELLWQKQLHLYEVPFYYIEYGFAQLGALALWKRYKENPEAGLAGYLAALKLGFTRPIPEIYKAAGISFNFTKEYIKSLMQFVREEMEKV